MAIVDINWKPNRKELRWFGGLLIVFCGVIAWVVSRGRDDSTLPIAIAATGLVVGVTGLLRPELIRYVYVAWMVAVSPIAFVVSNLIVAVVFYLVVTPIGLAMKFARRDVLKLELRRDADSHWVKKKMPKDARRYFRQY
ncbi:MAG: SxtJ family membrane protein [Planctomycetota bacterium]|nr:SxtJ family membrane protein [Planctomycetota bacterium]MDA1252583.1 SxtJ family membrane protein [Planctomycetota bacterium]